MMLIAVGVATVDTHPVAVPEIERSYKLTEHVRVEVHTDTYCKFRYRTHVGQHIVWLLVPDTMDVVTAVNLFGQPMKGPML